MHSHESTPLRLGRFFFARLDGIPGAFYNGRMGDLFSGSIEDRKVLTAAEAAAIQETFFDVVLETLENSS